MYSEPLSLEVIVSLTFPWLETPEVRHAIIEQIRRQEWGQFAFLASETVGLLGDAPAFAD